MLHPSSHSIRTRPHSSYPPSPAPLLTLPHSHSQFVRHATEKLDVLEERTSAKKDGLAQVQEDNAQAAVDAAVFGYGGQGGMMQSLLEIKCILVEH